MKTATKMTRTDCVVALSCIALAILTLGAVGSSGRRRAKELVCLSNLHQWNAIFQDYVQRTNGRFPAGDRNAYWWPTKLDEEHRNWKQTRIWFCPEAVPPTVGEDGRASPTLGAFNAWGIFSGADLGPHGISGSYALNGYTIIPDKIRTSSTYESGVPVANGWNAASDSGVANVPWFIDGLRFDLWPKEMDAPAVSEFSAWSGSSMARCCINRHNGAVNCLFLDGSARKVGIKELWTLKWHKDFNTTGPWTSVGGVLPNDWPNWMRPFKDF